MNSTRLLSPRSLLPVVFISLYQFLAFSQTPRDVAQRSFSSVVLLVMEDANGQPVSLGSGFFVRSNIVATNLHVVKNANRGYAKLVGKKAKYDISGYVAIDQTSDLALIEISTVKAPSMQLGESKQMAVGDEVFAIGNPQGLEGTFSQGIISGIRDLGTRTLFQITAPISPGSSGGPVTDHKGRVIGVAVATFKSGQNLNFAVPVSSLAELLRNVKQASPLSDLATTRTSSSLEDTFSSTNNEAIVGENFAWSYPDCSNCCREYSFSLRNRLRESLTDVYCLVVFYDVSRRPVEVDIVNYSGIIPGGLARRLTREIDASIMPLTTVPGRSVPSSIEYRVLDFRIVE